MPIPTLKWEANEAKPSKFLNWFFIWNSKYSQDTLDIFKCATFLKKLSSVYFFEKTTWGYTPLKQGSKPRKRRAEYAGGRGSNTNRGDGNSQDDNKGSPRKTTAAGLEQTISKWRWRA